MNSLFEQKKDDILVRLMNLNPEKVILFGSQAKKTNTEDSDFDILVIVSKSEHNRAYRTSLALKFLRGIGIPIDLLVYTKDEIREWEHIDNSFINEVLKTGKVIYEVRRAS